MAGRLDARAKLAATLLAVVAISTSPPGAWPVAAAHLALALLVASLSVASPKRLAGRIVLGVPFVLMAAALLFLTAGWENGVTVIFKGSAALVLLATLTLTTEVAELVWAVRRIGAPRSVNMIASMMLRYIEMLADEFARMSRARAARCGGPLVGVALFQVHGNQVGLLLVRSWERAERIHSAMVSRGFTGEMPETKSHRFGPTAWFVTLAVPLAFLALRWAVS